MDAIVVMIACAGVEEAEKISRMLVGERLAACVQRLPQMVSLFFWNGAIQEENEVLILAKSRKGLFQELSQKVGVLHSYEVPEITALPLADVEPNYLEWLRSTLR